MDLLDFHASPPLQMLEYRNRNRITYVEQCSHAGRSFVVDCKTCCAAAAQRSGLSRLDQLDRELEESLSAGSDVPNTNMQA